MLYYIYISYTFTFPPLVPMPLFQITTSWDTLVPTPFSSISASGRSFRTARGVGI